MQNATSQFSVISGLCAIIAPVILLGTDLFRFATGRDFEWTIGIWLAFVFFVPAIFGFTHQMVSYGSRLALVGGGLAFFGAMAGASMQVLFRTHAVLAEQGAAGAIEQLSNTFKLIASTQMIGLAWPLGLITLSIALLLTDRSRWLTSLLLASGAVAFPIGRIAGSNIAVIFSGLFFIAAFGLIGRELMKRSERLTVPE
jgi:hypothetical protein